MKCNKYSTPLCFVSDSMQADFKVELATELPTFLTSSQVFKVTAKQNIILPCQVTHPGK